MKFGKFSVKNPGKLHERLGVPEGQPISEDELTTALSSDDPKLRKSAQFQLNRMKSKGKYGIRPVRF